MPAIAPNRTGDTVCGAGTAAVDPNMGAERPTASGNGAGTVAPDWTVTCCFRMAPAKSSHVAGTRIGIDTWLMDSGTSLDAVNRADIQAYLQHIINGDKLILDTANGVTDAENILPMFLGPLGEHISPYVLDSTPNIV